MIGTPPSIKTRPEVSNATRSPPLDFSPFTAASKSFVSLAESCSQGWWNQACTIHTHSKHEKTGNGMSKEKCDTKKRKTSPCKRVSREKRIAERAFSVAISAPIGMHPSLRVQIYGYRKPSLLPLSLEENQAQILQFLPKGHALQGNQVATSITNRNGDLPAFKVASKATKIYKIALNH